MNSLRRARLAASSTAFFLSLVFSGAAAAQASLSVGADTDYRVRGLSLTGGRAVARGALTYDHRSGVYGGASVVFGELSGRVKDLGGTAYVGFARRSGSGSVFDMGVTSTRIRSEYTAQRPATYGPYGYTPAASYTARYRTEYSEVYAGVLRGPFSLHLYLSPNYLRPGLGTAYVDMNAAFRPAPRVRVFGHAGLLAPLERQTTDPIKTRADVRLGVAVELPHAEVQLAWTGVSRRVDYPRGYLHDRQAVVLSASAYF